MSHYGLIYQLHVEDENLTLGISVVTILQVNILVSVPHSSKLLYYCVALTFERSDSVQCHPVYYHSTMGCYKYAEQHLCCAEREGGMSVQVVSIHFVIEIYFHLQVDVLRMH